jgi:3-methyl-2-oxobutanoate hydroxymethyltransferase
MLHHTRAAAKGTSLPVIGDMPINSYERPEQALENARKFLEAGARAVKVEGCKEDVVGALTENGIQVMGHLGLLPQTAEKYGVQGKEESEAERIFQEAMTLDKLGVFALVLECVPSPLAKRITENVSMPTIGIGAGKDCDGQVLVLNDLLGLDESFKPKFVKRYADLSREIKTAVERFKKDVVEGKFPDEEHSFH